MRRQCGKKLFEKTRPKRFQYYPFRPLLTRFLSYLLRIMGPRSKFLSRAKTTGMANGRRAGVGCCEKFEKFEMVKVVLDADFFIVSLVLFILAVDDPLVDERLLRFEDFDRVAAAECARFIVALRAQVDHRGSAFSDVS